MNKKELLFYDAYEAFYIMAKKSNAFQAFCKDAFGEDFSQDGFSNIEQIDMILQYIPQKDTLSIGASIENMLLKATEIGLGTLWIANTCYAYKELTEYLETTQQLVGAIALGYADENPTQRPRKKMEDIVEYRL